MLTLMLIGSIVLSGNPGGGSTKNGDRPMIAGGIALSGNRAVIEFSIVEAQLKKVHQQLEAQEDAAETIRILKETIQMIKTIELKERLKVILSDVDEMYQEALAVRYDAAQAILDDVEIVMTWIRADILPGPGSMIYTTSRPVK